MGRFELANGGTMFLDEAGEIPRELKMKLLRVLDDQEFERLDSSRTMRVDVRLVTATNRDLAQMMEHGEFRSDLYYRLKVYWLMQLTDPVSSATARSASATWLTTPRS